MPSGGVKDLCAMTVLQGVLCCAVHDLHTVQI